MYYDDLDDSQKHQLAESYLCLLADCGEYSDVVGVDWDEPSYGELASASDIVPDDILQRYYGDVWFTEDDFF